MLFRINNLEDMDGMGLTINDLSLHGHGRDMVMAGWQHNSRSVFSVILFFKLFIRTVNIHQYPATILG